MDESLKYIEGVKKQSVHLKVLIKI